MDSKLKSQTDMIETPRLLIRPFRPQDGPALFEYLSNPDVYRFEPGEPLSLARSMEIARERSKKNHFWAVIQKNTQQLVGHLYFKQIEPMQFLTWELGYIFNPVFHNNGYASESSSALIRYGFQQFGIHRVTAHCNPENIASWRVMEKIGMTREGVYKKNSFTRRDENGSPIWTDTFAYAILKSEVENR
jgi:RimJ/RimL family protein N-acetyltransferase